MSYWWNFPADTPAEFKLMAEYGVHQLAGWTSAFNVTITPLFYQGVLAGSEFLTYDANKLYVALSLLVTKNSGTMDASPSYYHLSNELDAVSLKFMFDYPMYQPTGATVWFAPVIEEIKNVYFGRIAEYSGFQTLKFIGYKLTK